MFSLRRLITTVLFCAFAALVASQAPASAQAWPQRPVKFILPLGPGSGVDITARVFAERLSAKWGQPVVVENRPGGDAFVAITAVISAHDDHVLLFAPASTFTAHPLLHAKLPYEFSDLVPVARVTNTLIALGVPAALGVSTVKELVAKIKAAPGQLNYASVTGANDLMFAAFLKTEKIEMAKVPYKDPVTAINDLATDRIQAFVGAYAIMRPQIQNGKVKAIALTNLQHAAALPDIPTGKEAGYKSLEFEGLVGLLGPRELVPEVRERIAADIREIAADPAGDGATLVDRAGDQPGHAGRIRRRARRSTRHRGGDRQDSGRQTGRLIVTHGSCRREPARAARGGNDFLGLTNSCTISVEAPLNKMPAFSRNVGRDAFLSHRVDAAAGACRLRPRHAANRRAAIVAAPGRSELHAVRRGQARRRRRADRADRRSRHVRGRFPVEGGGTRRSPAACLWRRGAAAGVDPECILRPDAALAGERSALRAAGAGPGAAGADAAGAGRAHALGAGRPAGQSAAGQRARRARRVGRAAGVARSARRAVLSRAANAVLSAADHAGPSAAGGAVIPTAGHDLISARRYSRRCRSAAGAHRAAHPARL